MLFRSSGTTELRQGIYLRFCRGGSCMTSFVGPEPYTHVIPELDRCPPRQTACLIPGEIRQM
jgi:hypothetical protein